MLPSDSKSAPADATLDAALADAAKDESANSAEKEPAMAESSEGIGTVIEGTLQVIGGILSIFE